MLRILLCAVLAAGTLPLQAAERVFDFSQAALNQAPAGFVSLVSGAGQPGDWKIVEEDVTPALAPLTPNAAAASKRRVLAQLSQDATDEHFPLLVCTNEIYGDFTLTTRFKCARGSAEQMAGLAFRLRDEKNYYVVRASALGNTFRFYKFVNGVRGTPIGPEIPIAPGVWQEMAVTCKGSEIRCTLNGKEVIPPLVDHSFQAGKIGFWTKSDSVSCFTDARISYTPREPEAQKAVREVMERYPRIVGLKIFGYKNNELCLLASSNEKDLGQPGTKVEADIIKNEKIYTAKGTDTITVLQPLRDRNGECIAALHVTLQAFPGQTANNAIGRVVIIKKMISSRLQTAKDLLE